MLYCVSLSILPLQLVFCLACLTVSTRNENALLTLTKYYIFGNRCLRVSVFFLSFLSLTLLYIFLPLIAFPCPLRKVLLFFLQHFWIPLFSPRVFYKCNVISSASPHMYVCMFLFFLPSFLGIGFGGKKPELLVKGEEREVFDDQMKENLGLDFTFSPP